MALLNFKKEFAPKILDGSKCQTIRAKRRDCKNPRPGETLYCYVGLRTKGVKKLGEWTCVSVEEFSISDTGNIFYEGRWLNEEEAHEMALSDGFKCYYEMYQFFEQAHGLPFSGLLIRWEKR